MPEEEKEEEKEDLEDEPSEKVSKKEDLEDEPSEKVSKKEDLEEEIEESLEENKFELTPPIIRNVSPSLERSNDFQEVPVRLESRAAEFDLPTKEGKSTEELYTDDKNWNYDTQTSTREIDYIDNPVTAKERRLSDGPEPVGQMAVNQQLQDLRKDNPQRDEYLAHEKRRDDSDPNAFTERKTDYKA